MRGLWIHFHGYQPGDQIGRRRGKPDEMRFLERKTPLKIEMWGEKIYGRNWTEAMLKCYSKLIEECEDIFTSKYVTLDIEPYTLEMLAERFPSAFSKIKRMSEEGVIKIGLCPAFHPFIPHLPKWASELCIEIAKKVLSEIYNFKMIWLPECGISKIGLEAVYETLGEDFFVFSEDQNVGEYGIFRAGYLKIASRDSSLSDLFSFSIPTPEEMLSKLRGEEIIASDLETLFYSWERIEVLRKFLDRAEKEGIKPIMGEGPKGEIEIPEFSSWSDYIDLNGRKRDSRWLGLVRGEMRAYYREIFGKKVSQIWKFPYNLFRSLLISKIGRKVSDPLKYLPYFFPKLINKKGERVEYADRSLYEALFSLKSCPTFWEYPDTRVTFQSASFASLSLLDIAKEDEEFRDLYSLLLNFSSSYNVFMLGSFEGKEGWESSFKAFQGSLTSFIPEGLKADVFRRASTYSYLMEGEDLGMEVSDEDSSIITSHVPAEAGFEWEEKRFCEGGDLIARA